MAKCDECGDTISTEEKNNNSGMCEDCWHELNQDLDLGGTGHGDISYSDADSGL